MEMIKLRGNSKEMRIFFLLTASVWLCLMCTSRHPKDAPAEIELTPSNLPGSALAVKHCGECHVFPGPELLPRSVWEQDVLPSMGYRMGIFDGAHPPDSLFDPGIGGEIVRKAGIYPEKPVIAREDWIKIIDHYLENAPDTILPPKREKDISIGLKHFRYKESKFSHRPPLTIMVKILPQSRGIVLGDGKKDMSNLTFLTQGLEKDYTVRINTTPVHFYEKSDTVYLTTIGKSMYPHDSPDGTVEKVFRQGPDQQYKTAKMIISNIQRPVHMDYGDLNNDGLEDIVACEYGNLTGKLVWYENRGGDEYVLRPLRAEPGAIRAEIRDVNADGWMDVVALMAQGDEGMFWYENRGNGTFIESRMLTFSPLNGSQYFEFADFNNDGHEDLIYVCGDNADLTPILKRYHGIYIYLNDGNFKFSLTYFYQLNGAYKAMARDYDLDGDLDIAAISFFPDYYSYPEESFVYLENTGDLTFEDYSFKESTRGRWIVMDAADMDGDGDIDLALGSFVAFLAQGDTTGLGEQWIREGPSVAVLENTTK